jgi:hypothetical protein
MSRICFLADEDVSHDLIKALRSLEPTLDILAVGEPGAPAKRTPDPALLLFAEASGRTLLSGDRSTMTRHLGNHFAAGHQTWGLILLRDGFPLARYVADVHLIWFVETPADWVNRTAYIPF